jgi:5-methylcytosine-specific restriction endonuclease McrA
VCGCDLVVGNGALVPKGFKRDLAVSRLLHSNCLLRDKRSFATLPDSAGKIHLKLFGEDIDGARIFVFQRAWGKCEECRALITWEGYDMHHIKGGLSGRCDCLDNLLALCRDCHKAKHVQVRLGHVPRT